VVRFSIRRVATNPGSKINQFHPENWITMYRHKFYLATRCKVWPGRYESVMMEEEIPHDLTQQGRFYHDIKTNSVEEVSSA
jgi:hypothetical protein